MPKHATARTSKTERQMKDLASPEEMALREQVASRLGPRVDRPLTDAEKEFWREFEHELDRERLTFR
jgi:hypothetical protein